MKIGLHLDELQLEHSVHTETKIPIAHGMPSPGIFPFTKPSNCPDMPMVRNILINEMNVKHGFCDF